MSRYPFYLGQSYRDAGEKALDAYLRWAQLGFWQQEVMVSLLNAAPNRAEALHGAMRLCRLHNKFHQGYLLGKTRLDFSFAIGCPVWRKMAV